ncbi:Signal transduction histidine kinase [Sphingomonas sp. YR710]|uniref:hybrid sensor histidine kinase/response regulator n=1 Tax=Sphingomonas sp. YR710 TaxID=1882773 RepID=UPI00088ED18A|nr:ATP-binding protein [Sphingomonas sp. YR710]SDD28078.1 Signal transduction histidine kinase [Sphingomonas sp. YR710]
MQRSLALLAVTALLPIVIFGAIIGTFGFHNQRAAIERRALDHARFMATLIGRELITSEQRTEMIAQSPSLDAQIEAKRFTALGRRLLAIEPLWRTISVANPQGIRLLDIPEPIAGIAHGPVIETDSFERVVATHKLTIGRIGSVPGRAAAFAIRAPVIRDGRLNYVISTLVDPQVMSRLLLEANLPPRWRIEVIDQAGNIVAQTGAAADIAKPASNSARAALRRPPGLMYRDTMSGVDEMAIWQPIPGSEWTVHVAMPAAEYKAPILRASGVLLTGIIASLSLAVALVTLIGRDMAAQHRREEAATESQRMGALGRMTGGVAHDFNNLLTPVIAGLDMLQRRLTNDPKGLRLVEAALDSAERARTLVARLLSFARRQTLRPRDVDIVALLAGMRDLIERSIGSDVQLRYELPKTTLSARVDPAQLELAILNLAVNAQDAMPEGGLLTIGLTQEAAAGLSTRRLSPGDYVKISVTDTGEGMDAETLAQAIEPFFTTKPIGKGTGLGLSMVHGLAAQSGGALNLVSTPGSGTTIEIWLPLGSPPTVEEPQAMPAVDSRTARIMLVDDNVRVRHATAGLLREHGHVVIEAASGTEALATLAEGAAFDAIVTDYVMPGLSGAELAREVRARLPDIPILLITGFADLADSLPQNVERLGKPFRAAELLAQISAMLNGR